jgi:hypothetical protein
MEVYELYPDYRDECRRLTMPAGDLDEFRRRFEGTPMKLPWTDVTIGWVAESSLPKGDFLHLVLGLPIFSSRAINVLGDLLEGNGEILPTTCEGDQLFFFNVTKVIDALDESRSEVIRFDGRSEVMRVARYAFFSEKLTGAVIFKIPQFLTGRVFVTDPFVERVRSTGLRGFGFPRLWSTDATATIDWVW